jgi:magnesium transporter
MEINLKDINRLMDQGKLLRVRRMVSEFHPADLARLMEELSEEHKTDLFAVLDPKLAAEVVVELSDASRDQVLRDIHTTRLADIVGRHAL